MIQLNVRTLFVCFAALLLIVACADTSKKPAETEQTTDQPTPSQTAVSKH